MTKSNRGRRSSVPHSRGPCSFFSPLTTRVYIQDASWQATAAWGGTFLCPVLSCNARKTSASTVKPNAHPSAQSSVSSSSCVSLISKQEGKNCMEPLGLLGNCIYEKYFSSRVFGLCICKSSQFNL